MTDKFEPIYVIVGARPVKTHMDENGGTWVMAWDWERRIFVKAPEYFQQVFFPTDSDVDIVTEEEFEKRVDELLFA